MPPWSTAEISERIETVSDAELVNRANPIRLTLERGLASMRSPVARPTRPDPDKASPGRRTLHGT
jgi:hypothetical protein